MGNTFSHLGAVGLAFRNESNLNVISGNHFYDISSSGIFAGANSVRYIQVNLEPEIYINYNFPYVSRNHIISNNYIHDAGVEYESSAGITSR